MFNRFSEFFSGPIQATSAVLTTYPKVTYVVTGIAAAAVTGRYTQFQEGIAAAMVGGLLSAAFKFPLDAAQANGYLHEGLNIGNLATATAAFIDVVGLHATGLVKTTHKDMFGVLVDHASFYISTGIALALANNGLFKTNMQKTQPENSNPLRMRPSNSH